jgi:hypothetical protein
MGRGRGRGGWGEFAKRGCGLYVACTLIIE